MYKRTLPISVIIPSYNRVTYLRRALDSVVRQTAYCAEIIVVDDGSTDKTNEFLGTYAEKSEVPLKVYSQNQAGPAAARNAGITMSEQPLIAFLDSDDHWHKRKIECQYHAMVENPQYMISHTKEKWLRRGEHLNQKKIHIPRHGEIFDQCLTLCAVGMSTVMVRKDIFLEVGTFDESLQCCEDYDLWLRVSCRHKFLLVDTPLTTKEGGRDDQVSFQYRKGMDQLRIYSLQKLLDSEVLNEQQHFLCLKEFERKILIFGNGCKKHGRASLGEKYIGMISLYKNRLKQKFPEIKEQLDD